jgi:hypothetical protein
MNLKYKITITIVIALLFNNYYAQNSSNRITEIKKMYVETNKLIENKTNSNCKSATKTEYEGFDENSEKFPFQQSAEKCILTNEYQTLSGIFNGYEWNCNLSIYQKNGKMFFALMSSGAEACSSEYRIYYDINENVIKVLAKQNDCDGNSPTINKEITDKKEIEGTNLMILQHKAKIEEMVNNTK